MNSVENIKLDFFEFLGRQRHEDRQAFIIHFPANSGKTAFTKRLVNSKTGLAYLDVLERFAAESGFNIVNFGLQDLKKFLLNISFPQNAHTILVDQMDFLLNTWNGAEKRNFVEWLRVGLRSPSVSPYTWVFIIQYDGVICRQELINQQGEWRILPMNAFYEVK